MSGWSKKYHHCSAFFRKERKSLPASPPARSNHESIADSTFSSNPHAQLKNSSRFWICRNKAWCSKPSSMRLINCLPISSLFKPGSLISFLKCLRKCAWHCSHPIGLSTRRSYCFNTYCWYIRVSTFVRRNKYCDLVDTGLDSASAHWFGSISLANFLRLIFAGDRAALPVGDRNWNPPFINSPNLLKGNFWT